MRRIKYFIYSAGGILLAAGLIRFAVAVDPAQSLTLADPLLRVPLRWAVLLVGGIELAVALVCLFGKRVGLQVGLLAGLACALGVAGIGLALTHCQPQATCWGSLTDPLQLHHGIWGQLMNVVSGYVLVGGILVVPWFLFERCRVPAEPFKPVVMERTTLARSLKISCPECGGHIEFPTKFFGEKLPCPHCHAAIILQKARPLKMSCPGCGGHVEFSSDAQGQKTHCPHCKQELELRAG